MAFFTRNYRSFTFPDNSPDSYINIHQASKTFEASEYKPPFSAPPSGKLDGPGLKARIKYSKMVKEKRNLTPRTMAFLNWWKDRCSAMLDATGFGKRKIEKEIKILDGEIQSKYEKIHGAGGLCATIVELFNLMAETRLMVEYRDYLAYTCSFLKEESMADMIWKVEKLDWQDVGKRVLQEEKQITMNEERGLAPLVTPCLDHIREAAIRLDCEFGLVRYQILAYARRNNFVHNGIKSMIHHGDFSRTTLRSNSDAQRY